ncbi:MAG: 30S ribosomal protein S16 [Candidatus Omnitrophota bacterium]
MAVVIRLARLGSKRKPHHKIVVIEQHRPRDGRFIEEIGYYDPSHEPAFVDVKVERAMHWLSVGAQPSPTVKSIFKSKNIPLKVKRGQDLKSKVN